MNSLYAINKLGQQYVEAAVDEHDNLEDADRLIYANLAVAAAIRELTVTMRELFEPSSSLLDDRAES